jgi:hypothetical protein
VGKKATARTVEGTMTSTTTEAGGDETMTDGRRYSEEEVEAILARAAERSARLTGGRGTEEGLTLPELQEIGAEVGIPPAVVADAARSLERRSGTERTLGLPMGVSHSVPLSRPPTDVEWERLVADLRETFRARGKVRVDGGLRGWHNGNLHALVEPTADGWRLRMGTRKGDARALLAGGSFLLLLATLFGLMALLGLGNGDPAALLGSIAILGGLGTVGVGVGAGQLPGWARERQVQMEGVGRRAEAMLGEGEAPEPPSSVPPRGP